jgi:hypothetical protein
MAARVHRLANRLVDLAHEPRVYSSGRGSVACPNGWKPQRLSPPSTELGHVSIWPSLVAEFSSTTAISRLFAR